MKSMTFKLSKTIAATVVLTTLGAAQISPEKPATATPPVSAKVALPLPFQPGETLVYEMSFSKLIFSGIVGDIKISVSKPVESASIEFKAEAVSRGFFPTLLGFKIKDTYSSVVNAQDLGLHSFKRSIQEGKARREQTAAVNRETGRVTYTDRNLADAKAQPRIKEAASPAWVQDMLSAIYFVRTQKLNQDDVIAIPISDGGNIYNIEVLVGKREELKLALGKFKTVQLEARVFDGRFIKRSGEMLVWLSDDPKRLIIRVRIKTSGATVTAELKRIG